MYLNDRKPIKCWPIVGRLKFVDYSAKYREELGNVLSEINLEIQPGEKIGLIGSTAAGKSSLVLGLFRMLQQSNGAIFIDGVNIEQIGLHDLRRQLTIIQHVIFF